MTKNTHSGFTLIEVLIAMAIFSFIAAATAGAITRGLKVKKRVEGEWNDIQGIRTALTVMGRDLTLAFHKLKNQQMFGGGRAYREKWFKTYFKARKNEINFTSLTNRKFYANTHESEMCEIGYRLTEDPEALNKRHLTRRIDMYIDDEPEKGGKTQRLLENVKEISFRFYSTEKERWVDDWDSDHPDYEDKFPNAVEIKLVMMTKEKETPYTTTLLIGNPNNERPAGPLREPQ